MYALPTVYSLKFLLFVDFQFGLQKRFMLLVFKCSQLDGGRRGRLNICGHDFF